MPTKISMEIRVTMLLCNSLIVFPSVPGDGYVRRDKPGIIGYDVAHRSIDITDVAVFDPG